MQVHTRVRGQRGRLPGKGDTQTQTQTQEGRDGRLDGRTEGRTEGEKERRRDGRRGKEGSRDTWMDGGGVGGREEVAAKHVFMVRTGTGCAAALLCALPRALVATPRVAGRSSCCSLRCKLCVIDPTLLRPPRALCVRTLFFSAGVFRAPSCVASCGTLGSLGPLTRHRGPVPVLQGPLPSCMHLRRRRREGGRRGGQRECRREERGEGGAEGQGVGWLEGGGFLGCMSTLSCRCWRANAMPWGGGAGIMCGLGHGLCDRWHTRLGSVSRGLQSPRTVV